MFNREFVAENTIQPELLAEELTAAVQTDETMTAQRKNSGLLERNTR